MHKRRNTHMVYALFYPSFDNQPDQRYLFHYMHGSFIIKIAAFFVLLAFGLINVTTCLAVVTDEVACSDIQCEDNQRSGEDHQEENETDRCCGHTGHCGHASALLFGRPSQLIPSQSDERLVHDDQSALDGPVFGIDRPPQLA